MPEETSEGLDKFLAVAEQLQTAQADLAAARKAMDRPVQVTVRSSEKPSLDKIVEYLPQLGLMASNTAEVAGKLIMLKASIDATATRQDTTLKGLTEAVNRVADILDRLVPEVPDSGLEPDDRCIHLKYGAMWNGRLCKKYGLTWTVFDPGPKDPTLAGDTGTRSARRWPGTACVSWRSTRSERPATASMRSSSSPSPTPRSTPNMADPFETLRTCASCGHSSHVEECSEQVGYDHLNGDQECGCPSDILLDAALAGRRAMLDPGAFVTRLFREDGDLERMDQWQERALHVAVQTLGRTIPRPPPPDRFPIHTITVTHVFGEEDDLHGDGIEYEWDLDHGDCQWENCSVWMDIHEGGGLREALLGGGYSRSDDTPWPWVTTYYVKTWTQTHDIPGEPIEYDQGLYVTTIREDLE